MNDLRTCGVDLIGLVLSNAVAERGCSSCNLALKGIFFHSSLDVDGEVLRVVFSIALHDRFEDDTFGCVRDILFCVEDLDSILFQLGLVDG